MPEATSTKARRHQRNCERAAVRRAKDEYTVPMNAVIPLASLPAKNRTEVTEQLREQGVIVFYGDKNHDDFSGEDGKPIMVLDPMRGLKLRGKALSDKLAKRRDQQRRIDAKREQREAFAKLKPQEKFAHRYAGRASRGGR